jgi:hypothetical protein
MRNFGFSSSILDCADNLGGPEEIEVDQHC